MKVRVKNVLFLSALTAGFGLMLAGRGMAQTFTTLHTFTVLVSSTNSDGANPYDSLLLVGNTLYGTAENGGKSGKGTLFTINTDGSAFTNLYNFTATATNLSGAHTNGDGAAPGAILILSGTTLYGEALQGGGAGNGTVFGVGTNGTSFTNVHSFTNSNGSFPIGGLVLSGNTLYGTAFSGGSNGLGSVFAVNTDGSSFTNVHLFTNGDGAFPQVALVLSGNTLYGTTLNGGKTGNGTVFAVNTNGSGFTNLYSFTATVTNSSGARTNGDGGGPQAGLILSGGTLYGTANGGGTNGSGTIFAISTNGALFTTLYNFTATAGALYPHTNLDGANPDSPLIISGNTLYGTAGAGGTSGRGTVFAVKTDGTDFKNLHSFTALSNTNSDGINPFAGLVLSGNTLYGLAEAGGTNNSGTVFSITLPVPPQLTIIGSGTNAILTWPTNATGFTFTLQSTTNLAPPPVWTDVSNAPVIVTGQNTATNPISGAQQFFRLSQ
jgi:uncharacterized repeat protein (TIGR03803 family)